jgi:hypothetical protein
MERESKSDTGNNRGNWNRFKIWNHFKINQTVPEQRTRKARIYGTKKSCEIIYGTQIVNKKGCNTIYPRNMVCFRYIIVNTLHKGDNKDNNNNNNNNTKSKNSNQQQDKMYQLNKM